jgi:hypothetical protein
MKLIAADIAAIGIALDSVEKHLSSRLRSLGYQPKNWLPEARDPPDSASAPSSAEVSPPL